MFCVLRNTVLAAAFGVILANLVAPDAFAGPTTGDSMSVYFAQPNVSTPYTGECANSPPGCFSHQTFTVGSGVETTFEVPTPVADISFSNGSLEITWVGFFGGNYRTSFQGFVFTDSTSNFDPIVSVSGLSSSLVSESGDQLYVNLGTASSGFGFNAGDTITVDFAAAAVPEPASLALLAVGLAGLGMVLRTRQT